MEVIIKMVALRQFSYIETEITKSSYDTGDYISLMSYFTFLAHYFKHLDDIELAFLLNLIYCKIELSININELEKIIMLTMLFNMIL